MGERRPGASMQARIEQTLRRCIVCLEYLCVFLFAVMCGSLTVQIVARYLLFNASTAWAEELARYAMVWIVFLGAVIATSRCAHTRIEFFVRLFSPRLQVCAEVMVNALCMTFLLVVAYHSQPLLEVSLLMLAPALQVPMAAVYSSVPVCSILMTIYLAWNTVMLFLRPAAPIATPDAEETLV